MKNKKGFTLLELLVAVLIIGILAAIALPQYQLAVDKAKFTKIMNITKAIQEAQERAVMSGYENPSFSKTDFDVPANCSVSGRTFSCDNNNWGCFMFTHSRCSDLTINATYIHNNHKWYCCAHSTEQNDRTNRMCKSLTGNKSGWNTDFHIFNNNLINMKCYAF